MAPASANPAMARTEESMGKPETRGRQSELWAFPGIEQNCAFAWLTSAKRCLFQTRSEADLRYA
jgi:hypothetical protein